MDHSRTKPKKFQFKLWPGDPFYVSKCLSWITQSIEMSDNIIILNQQCWSMQKYWNFLSIFAVWLNKNNRSKKHFKCSFEWPDCSARKILRNLSQILFFSFFFFTVCRFFYLLWFAHWDWYENNSHLMIWHMLNFPVHMNYAGFWLRKKWLFQKWKTLINEMATEWMKRSETKQNEREKKKWSKYR